MSKIENGESGVAALDRAFAILRCFQEAEAPLRLTDIAKQSGLYKSTILRLIGSLIHHNMVERLDDTRYRLGAAAFQLGTAYQRAFAPAEVLLPIMRELGDLTSESVAFYIRNASGRACLYRVESKHAIRYMVREGDVLPLNAGSGGRVLAAYSGEPGEPYETIRREGIYISLGERDPETCGVSVPVFGPHKTLVGALTLAGPRTRVDEAFLKCFEERLREAAARATRAFGGSSPR